MVAVGIDLGTTYSCVAVWKDNHVEVIANEQGNRTTPSYVAFTRRERLIGEAAKNQAAINSTNTIFATKRLIGRRYEDVGLQMDIRRYPFRIINQDERPKIRVEHKGDVRLISPIEISGMILIKMKQVAEVYLGKKVDKAVISVPAYFTDAQRQATKLAGMIAGLEIIGIINEPTAAALAYGYNKKICGRNILIYDLGGGTFDVSILTLSNSVYKVKATAGNSRLGGEDFDQRLVTYFAEDFKKRFGKEVLENKKCLMRLKSASEKAKLCLTSAVEATVHIESLYDGIDYDIRITRALFENLCSDLFKETLKLIEKVLSDAKMETSHIHEVILLGGSTRIPKIKSLLKYFFDEKVISCINSDEAVAYGAAIQAALLTGKRKNEIIVDVVPLSIGVITARGMFTVIERNTAIPCRKVREITTLEDYQVTMKIDIFEGERTLTKDKNLLGVFKLNNIPPAPRGWRRIDIIFDVDDNGILKLSAQDKGKDNSRTITIENLYRLTYNEVYKMSVDVQKFQEEDEENKRQLEVRNQLETYIYGVKYNVEYNKEILSSSEYSFMIDECRDALVWLEKNMECLREEYDRKMSELLCRWSSILQKLIPKESEKSEANKDEPEKKKK